MAEEPRGERESEEPDVLRDVLERLDVSESARWIDLASAVLLSLAVVFSAFSAWEATLWSGRQSTSFAEASSLRVQSNRELAIGVAEISYDASTFADAAAAYVEGQDEVVELYENRIAREEFLPALDAWLALDPQENPNAPRTPLGLEDYSNTHLDASQDLTEQAEEKFDLGKEANGNGDDYILSTVLFASVLFFAGVSTKFKSQVVRGVALFIAVGAFGGALAWLISLPRLEVGF